MKKKIIGIMILMLLFFCTFQTVDAKYEEKEKENAQNTNSAPFFSWVLWPMATTKVGQEIEVFFAICDYNSDDVMGFVDWGDGCAEYTDWKATNWPDECAGFTVPHIYNEKGTFTITITPFDEEFNEGDSKYYTITVQGKIKALNKPVMYMVRNNPHLLQIFQ